MPKSTKQQLRWRAFDCDFDTLSGLWRLLEGIPGAKPEIEIKLRDGSELTFEDLSEVRGFPNNSERMIRKLTLHSGYRAETVIRIELEGTVPAILTRISGEDRDVVDLDRRIWDHLKTLYSWRHLLAMALALLLSFLVMALVDHIYGAELSALQSIPVNFVIVASMLFLWRTAFVGNPITWLFPPANFLIGAGVKRAGSAAAARNVIFVCIVLALVVALLANYLTQRMQG